MKKFHIAVQKSINSPWLYDNYACIKDEYCRQTLLFLRCYSIIYQVDENNNDI